MKRENHSLKHRLMPTNQKQKMKERKKELRKLIAEEKAKYSASMLKDLSADILLHLEKHPAFRDAKTVLLYHSMKDEVYTHSFIDKWTDSKQIVLPVVVGDTLEIRRYEGIGSMKPGPYGILEPIGTVLDNYSSIDLVVVPGVAFDRERNRLGHGKGYYDKILPQLAAYKIGICFPFQLVEKVPADSFDVKMDAIIVGASEI